MTKHTRLIELPERIDSLSVLRPQVHERYAQYFNARSGQPATSAEPLLRLNAWVGRTSRVP